MWDYSKKVLDHFLHPRNVGIIDDADARGEVGSLACGDALVLTLKLDQDKRIVEAKFKTFGCASAIASSSALTEIIKGMTLEEAEKITNRDIANYLDGLPEAKMHCSVMGREALQEAIKSYRGIKTEEKKVLEGEVVCKCFGVTEKELKDTIRANSLTSLEQVTNYTKAGGGCRSCHPDIIKLLEEAASEKAATVAKETAKQMGYKVEKGKLTNLQKIALIQDVIDKSIRPMLKCDGGDIALIDIDGNIVSVALHGACKGCIGAQQTMKYVVEKQLKEKVSADIVVNEVKED